MLAELARKCRSIRRFKEHERISLDTLRELVDVGRLAASAGNAQPLKYKLAVDPGLNANIFTSLSWAGHLAGWDGPEQGERPAAYIIVLHDNTVTHRTDVDHGAEHNVGRGGEGHRRVHG